MSTTYEARRALMGLAVAYSAVLAMFLAASHEWTAVAVTVALALPFAPAWRRPRFKRGWCIAAAVPATVFSVAAVAVVFAPPALCAIGAAVTPSDGTA